MLNNSPQSSIANLINEDVISDLKSKKHRNLEFFQVSSFKFAVMATCTLGLYEFYWFYKNWELTKIREESKIIPLLRAFFSFIFCFSLISKIRDRGVTKGLELTFGLNSSHHKFKCSVWLVCIPWISTSLMLYSSKPIWWLSLFAWIYLLPAVRLVNDITKLVSPDSDKNSSFSVWNWLAIVLGGTCVVLNIGQEILALFES